MPGLKPFYTYNLLDAVNITEYLALNEVNRHLLDVIISAGILDYAEDSQARVFIESIFPVGTTTCTNITAILNKYIALPIVP